MSLPVYGCSVDNHSLLNEIITANMKDIDSLALFVAKVSEAESQNIRRHDPVAFTRPGFLPTARSWSESVVILHTCEWDLSVSRLKLDTLLKLGQFFRLCLSISAVYVMVEFRI